MVRTATKLALITLASAGLVFVETAAMSVWGERSIEDAQSVDFPNSEWIGKVEPHWPPPSALTEVARFVTSDLHSQVGSRASPTSNATGEYLALFVRVGWPARCFTHAYTQVYSEDRQVQATLTSQDTNYWLRGAPIPEWLAREKENWVLAIVSRRIPLRPIWPGFAINTALHVLVLSLPVFGLPALRRSLRRRRGLCTKCAYSRTGLAPGTPCPECGQLPG